MSTETSSEQTTKSAASIALAASEPDLFGQTLRTIAVLVGACVLFVGTLSTAAVLITSKAMGPSAHESSAAPDAPSPTAKKPLSI
jgi:hypothetical protein